MIRRTKIVVTLGPATDKPGVMEALLLAGVNVVRLNFSHGTREDHKKRANEIRSLADKHGLTVAILGDLQGPKIRIARFSQGSVVLGANNIFFLDVSLDSGAGDHNQVGVDYLELPNDISIGDRLLLDDGRLVLEVLAISGPRIKTKVIVGGRLYNNKGINREGGGLSAAALTDKDYQDISLAADIGIDYLAVSFVRSCKDIQLARQLLNKEKCNAALVAKIERAEAVGDYELLDQIILASDAVMVARGDLGVEIGDAELIAIQKHIIKRARQLNRCVITATQMMESMIQNPLPTRAEVFDVANAVLDGTDAVMLSGETAAGKYPLEAVQAMIRVIVGAEGDPKISRSQHRLHEDFKKIDESVAMAAMYTANHLSGVKAIISLTETGNTPLLMTRISSGLPVVAFTRHQCTANRVALYRGVIPTMFAPEGLSAKEVNRLILQHLLSQNVVDNKDLVIISRGDYTEVCGGTNTLKIISVEGEMDELAL